MMLQVWGMLRMELLGIETVLGAAGGDGAKGSAWAG